MGTLRIWRQGRHTRRSKEVSQINSSHVFHYTLRVCPEEAAARRVVCKKELKASFDSEYDVGEGEGGSSYLEELKREVSEQEELNRLAFEGMDDAARLVYEGARPGSYVRMEIKGLFYDGVLPAMVSCSLPPLPLRGTM